MAETLGFIGLGHMGAAMARRLLGAGFRVIGHDTDPARLEALRIEGLEPAPDARAVADRAVVVFASLPSFAASRAVAAEVAQGCAVRVVVECSTIGVGPMRELAALLGARGIALVDAPLSGGPGGVAAGTVAVIASGPPDAITRIRPPLDRLAGSVKIVGDQAGQAQICKVVNNVVSICAMAITCEAVVAGVKAGMDAETLVEVLNLGTGRTSASTDKFPRAILPRSFDFGGAIEVGNKDLALYLDLARAGGLDGAMVAQVAQVWRDATETLGAQTDYSALAKVFEEKAGVVVRGRPASDEVGHV
jgi:3-hydroxyisobutyrate dehydrogenase